MCTTFPNAQCGSADSAAYVTRGNVTGVVRYTNAGAATGALTTSSAYDIAGNVVSVTDAKGYTSQVSYDDSFCNGSGCGGTFTPNTYAFPSGTTSPVPDVSTAYGYPAGSFGSTSALTTTTVYDFYTGLVRLVTDANGKTQTLEYADPLDRPTAEVRPDGSRTDLLYSDAVGNLYVRTLSDLDATRRTESRQYFDGLGRPYRSLTYENQVTASPWVAVDTQYDALGRVVKSSLPYRSAGGATPLTATQWANAKRNETRYDALGRVTAVQTLPDTATVTTAYSGDATTVTDQAGKSRKTVSDALGRLREVYEDPSELNYLTGYTYDPLGNLRTVTQGSQTRNFVYDSLGRMTSATNPESGTTAYAYDANGNLLTRTYARGVATTYTYDRLNRNILTSYAGGGTSTPEARRHYDGATNGLGRLHWTEAVGVSASVFDAYDATGRPTQYHQSFWTGAAWGSAFGVQRAYNKAGAVASQTYPSGRTVSYSYDAAGRLGDNGTQAAFRGNLGDNVQRTYVSEVRYHEMGGREQERFGTVTPVYNKSLYNGRGQLAEIRVSTYSLVAPGQETSWNRGAIINHYSTAPEAWGAYGGGPDNNGNLKKQEVYIPHDEQITQYTNIVQEYNYDDLNRLTSVYDKPFNGAADFSQGYSYDRWGNRTVDAAVTANAPEPAFTASASTNRLSPPAGYMMTYDAVGNLINDNYTGAGTRAYDGENRMTSAQDYQGQTSSYAYDADGKRVRRSVAAGASVWQVYGMEGELLAEYSVSSAPSQPQKEYGYRGGELLVVAETPPRVNVALAANGATAAASSTYDANRAPLAAINGDRRGLHWGSAPATGSGWHDATGNAYPDWLEVTFPGSKTIDEINVFGLQDNHTSPQEPTEAMTGTTYGLTAFDVQYWTGAAWATVPGGSVTGNTNVWRKFTFPAVTTSKVRVLAQGGAGGFSRVVELEAYQVAAGAADVRWLVADQLGTPRIIMDKTGSLAGVRRRDYLPFGEEIPADTTWRTPSRGYAGDNVRQEFTGYERDTETALDYAQARYFASTQGRFTSVDPVAINVSHMLDPQRINLYSYARNNPLLFVDPTGEMVRVTGGGSEQYLQWLEGATGVDLELDPLGYVRIAGDIPDELTNTQRALLDMIMNPFILVDIEARQTDPNLMTDHYEGGDGLSARMTVNVGNIKILAQPNGMTPESVSAHILVEGFLGADRGVKRLEDNPSIHLEAIDKGENGVRRDQGLSPRNAMGVTHKLGRYQGRPAIEMQIDFGSHHQYIVVEAKVTPLQAVATGNILATKVLPKRK
jgi:RHS repeat-associated protein